MVTSVQWWNKVKNDESLFIDWLHRQWRGEVTAANRIRRFKEQFSTSQKQSAILDVIALQEETHAQWVQNLLVARGLTLDQSVINEAEKRYWVETLPGIVSFETGAAVAAHAEKMRLDRIKAIAEDSESPEDVRDVFTKILRDEIFHEKAFREMSGDQYASVEFNHELGKLALGLEA